MNDLNGKSDLEKATLVTALRWLIVVSMPFLLGLGSIRAIIAWDYPSFEYKRIAPDAYGFSFEQRRELAHATLDYLRRPEPANEVIYMLEELRLPESNQPLYNEREIGHMLDVKNLADVLKRIVWFTAIVTVVGLSVLILRPETRSEGYRAILQGGIATTVILLAIALFILLAWQVFFVQFHQLLFPPNTWSFAYSDGLIRLFPEQFWFDVGVIVSVGTLIEGFLVAAAGYLLLRGV